MCGGDLCQVRSPSNEHFKSDEQNFWRGTVARKFSIAGMTETVESIRLYVYPYGPNLCATSPDCLSVMIYSSRLLSPGTWKVIELNNAELLVTGRLPSMHDLSADMWYTGFEDISAHLRQLGLDHDTDSALEENLNTQVQLQHFLEQAKNITVSECVLTRTIV